MKVTSIITIVFMVVSVCALNAAVNPQNYSRMDKDGDGKDGMVDASEAWNANFMKAVDADKNGKISRDEAEAYHFKIAAKVDVNSDAFITLEELNPKG